MNTGTANAGHAVPSGQPDSRAGLPARAMARNTRYARRGQERRTSRPASIGGVT
jgi:hypothetical protein